MNTGVDGAKVVPVLHGVVSEVPERLADQCLVARPGIGIDLSLAAVAENATDICDCAWSRAHGSHCVPVSLDLCHMNVRNY